MAIKISAIICAYNNQIFLEIVIPNFGWPEYWQEVHSNDLFSIFEAKQTKA